MQIESALWEKLTVDLELLNAEDPNSILPILFSAQKLLGNPTAYDATQRAINFMIFDLKSQCEDLSEKDRLSILLDYFFSQRNFSIPMKSHSEWQLEDLFVQNVVENRSGHPIPLGFLFLHLANQLDLPIYFIHFPKISIVRWFRGTESTYIDLSCGGHFLTQNELLQMLNNAKISEGASSSIASAPLFEIVPSKVMISEYVESFVRIFKTQNEYLKLLCCYNMFLQINPHHLAYLGQRALLQQGLGQYQEALQDLKRYFSFTPREHAPRELQIAYYELTNPNPMIH